MSWCRFSTPHCDLYCYESELGFMVNIAANRHRIWYDALYRIPDHVYGKRPRFFWYTIARASSRIAHHIAWRWPFRLTHKGIGLPDDGGYFFYVDFEDFLAKVKSLRDMGYQVPDYLIPELEEELQERNNNPKGIR